ncbi:hypothetical protein [Natrinema longum]|uniref:Uncharacterized protein n=1 Tax=Natrinema longum TaxID=370324 RepID=A0A8A2U723_9EURY|nr:hypothetical protein [Natrinema longum]MBZ6494230.1 hypothetical protein [Natrinema longum]QSW84444.1 hypothetical protein J0X27_13425 [Natrinema longum]
MRRILLVVTLAVLVSIAGCSGFGGNTAEPSSDTGNTLESEDPAVNATATNQTVRIEATESVVGSEWESLSVTYPRENFTVDSAQHGEIVLGVDTNGDGSVDRTFNETHISGVNNNDYSFTIELETGYTFESGDAIVAEYPAVDNPAEAGEYTVAVTLNEAQTTNGTITVTDEEQV